MTIQNHTRLIHIQKLILLISNTQSLQKQLLQLLVLSERHQTILKCLQVNIPNNISIVLGDLQRVTQRELNEELCLVDEEVH